VLARVAEEGLAFAQAVALGAMIEPPNGVPDLPPLLDELGRLDVDLFAIVEQDLYPCDPDTHCRSPPVPRATWAAAASARCARPSSHPWLAVALRPAAR